MDLFPHGSFVRLESRGRTGKFVHADADWFGVSLRPLGLGTVASLEAVWRVEHMADQGGVIWLLLQSAAYGRYLSTSQYKQAGHLGSRAIQDDRTDHPNNVPPYNMRWWWRVERVQAGEDDVRLRFDNTQRFLRANGRFLTMNNGVTVDYIRQGRLTTMMQWTVHAVAASPEPIPLPVAPPHQPPQIPRARGLHSLLFWRVHQQPERTIRYVWASNEGDFDQDHQHWPELDSYNNSVINLRNRLVQLQNDGNGDMLTLCIRSGFHGRPMPLVIDLPRSLDPMNIVVYRTGSPAAAELRYPLLYAPAL